MKKVAHLFILLICTGFYGQNGLDENILATDSPARPTSYLSRPDILGTPVSLTEKETMYRALTDNKVKFEEFNGLTHVSPGYYIIANVFRNTRYLDANLKKLNKIGLTGGSIFNDDRSLHYLYLERYDHWEDALEAYTSDLNGAYTQDKWMMIVQSNNGYASDSSEDGNPKVGFQEDAIPIEAVTYEMLTSLGAEEPSHKDDVPLNGNSWIWRANEYFDKMWYAEAAELYEKALERNPDNQDMEILQRVGDAHYFNTNMERAHFWYQKLYDVYKDGMDADYLFKYAHTLKGMGKYSRAKRFMRTHDGRKGNSKGTDSEGANDVILLDQLLEKEHRIDLKNLSINSKYSDFGPMFYKGDEIVYSSAREHRQSNTRRYKWSNQPFLDLYMAKIAGGSQELKDPSRFSKTINTKYHEAAVSFTSDFSTMYFTRNNYDKELKRNKDGSNNLKIYVSKKVDGKWTKAKELPFNSDRYSMGHPALSPDGKKLYFISDMPGTIGETDIFVVDVLGDDNYSRPKNLGPGINTERKEMFPFITDKKLYFSSNGRVGLGGLDVYEALLDDEGGFKPAINLGRPINSERDDFSYIVDEGTDQGYFASNRKGGQGDDDLYSFQRQISEEEIRNSITGTVHELISGDFAPNALVSLLDGDKIVNEMVTHGDGSFAFDGLDPAIPYTVKVTKDEFFENIIPIGTERDKVVHLEVPMKKLRELIVLEDGVKKLKTDKIYFDFDQSSIRKDASHELDKLVAVMKEYKDMVIKIEAHTDSRGVAAYNQYLSDKRAKSTRDYLISKGISEDRIASAIGYGEAQLINECQDGVPCSRQNHERNRRSEFIIVSM